MSITAQTLNEFGISLGLNGLALSDQGNAVLGVEQLGTLYLEQGEGEMLIYLTREVPPYDEGIPEKALQLCHHNQGHPFSVQTAMKGNETLVFMVRLPEAEFTLPNINRCLNLLEQLHNSVTENKG